MNNRRQQQPEAESADGRRRSYLALDILAVLTLLLAFFVPALDPDMTTFTAKEETQLSFLVDWHDPAADQPRRFNLNYFPKDNSVEMVKHSRTICFGSENLIFLPAALAARSYRG